MVNKKFLREKRLEMYCMKRYIYKNKEGIQLIADFESRGSNKEVVEKNNTSFHLTTFSLKDKIRID